MPTIVNRVVSAVLRIGNYQFVVFTIVPFYKVFDFVIGVLWNYKRSSAGPDMYFLDGVFGCTSPNNDLYFLLHVVWNHDVCLWVTPLVGNCKVESVGVSPSFLVEMNDVVVSEVTAY